MTNISSENNSCVIYANYLDPVINSELFKHAIAKESDFEFTQVIGKNEEGELNLNYRKSVSLAPRNFLEFYKLLKKKIKADMPRVCEILGIEHFELDDVEMHLTSHNHGEFYKPHIDNGGILQTRVITFVYYFHSMPKQFEGGQLLFLRNKPKPLIVPPDNNTIVFFDSSLLHAVHPVSCPSKKFADGRFTMNGWLLKKVEHASTTVVGNDTN